MGNVLLVAEHVHGKLPKTTLVGITAAKLPNQRDPRNGNVAGVHGLHNSVHEWLADGTAGRALGRRIGIMQKPDASTVGVRFVHTKR